MSYFDHMEFKKKKKDLQKFTLIQRYLLQVVLQLVLEVKQMK